jgi:S-DNA-T family DNA segregation ATPase FtsK/SpoIIIE
MTEEALTEVPVEAQTETTRKPRVVKHTQQSARETEEATAEVTAHIQNTDNGKEASHGSYRLPPIDLLTKGTGVTGNNEAYIQDTIVKLQSTLDSFGVHAMVTDYSCGPAVTRFELQPEQGVKVSKIVGLSDDIKLSLAATDIRIEAPIPGKAAIGIEIPNKENSAVMLRDLLDTDEFRKFPSDIAFAAGKDIAGQTVVTDIAKMPHLLIAGATGSGKSVCINTIIMSILYKASPEDVKLIMIDPKVVELTAYNGIPHLLIPVVTDPKKAAGALNWAVQEMTKRYQVFADYNVRNIKGYNKKVEETLANLNKEEADSTIQKMPQIVVIVDELADLMMVAKGEVEDAIVRLAQLARAAGIHLIIATQRPSVDVITGLIKANVPSRIAFAVSSFVDSKTILDMGGAEKLLGKGDMLFYPTGYPKPVRVQGAFVSDDEVARVVEYLKDNCQANASDADVSSQIESNIAAVSVAAASEASGDDKDEYFRKAAELIIESDKASIGMLQRRLKIGFNRAARIMDQLAEAGIVGPDEGTKPRQILMSAEQFEQYVEESL